MTAVDDLLATVTGDTTEPDGPVVKNGRYHHVHPVTGEAMTSQRATNFVKLLADTFMLEQWDKRMVLLGAAMRPDLTAQAIAAGAEDKEALNRLAAEAKEAAGGNRGANLGSAMHDLTDRIDRGETVPVPAPLDADLNAYRQALAAHGVRIRRELIEKHVCLPDLGVVGRFDRIVEWDGRLVIADLKTQASFYGFLEIAVQLALYAHADWMWEPGTGWTPKPPVDLTEALVFHLPVGQAACHLYAVDIAAGWEAVQEADKVRQWRRRSRGLARALDTATVDDLEQLLAAPAAAAPAPARGREVLERVRANMAARGATDLDGALDPPPAPPVVVDPAVVAEASAGLRARIQTALTVLSDVLPPFVEWPADVPKYRDGGPTTWQHVKQVEAFVIELEKETQAPFADPLPDDPSTPVDKVVGLMANLAASVEAAKDARARHQRSTTPAEVYEELKARFAAIAPDDIRTVATGQARELGVADVAHLDGTQLAALSGIVEAAEHEYTARKAHLTERLAPWGRDEAVCFVAAVADDRTLEELNADDVTRLDCLLDALDAGTLGLTVDDDGTVRLVVAAVAELDLVRRYGGKAALLNAAKTAADRHGRPRPRSACQAVADPLLVAALTASASPPGVGGGEEHTTQNPEPSQEQQ